MRTSEPIGLNGDIKLQWHIHYADEPVRRVLIGRFEPTVWSIREIL